MSVAKAYSRQGQRLKARQLLVKLLDEFQPATDESSPVLLKCIELTLGLGINYRGILCKDFVRPVHAIETPAGKHIPQFPDCSVKLLGREVISLDSDVQEVPVVIENLDWRDRESVLNLWILSVNLIRDSCKSVRTIGLMI